MIWNLASKALASKALCTNRTTWYAALTVGIGILVAILFLNPLWQSMDLHVPGESTFPVDFTQPVDSIFYIRNAENGFTWTTENTISTAFHPLLVWLIRTLPSPISYNIRFWVISVLAAFFSLIAVYYYVKEISDTDVKPLALVWVLVLPGGLGIATGNAEFPCLLFTTLLSLSVLKQWRIFWPVFFGILAILTKPNAAYMIPFLGVYAVFQRNIRIDIKKPDSESIVVTFVHQVSKQYQKIVRNSWLGIVAIVLAWAVWIIIVDFRLGESGGYFRIREYYTVPLDNGIFSLFSRTAEVLLLYSDFGEQMKFVTAIVIPLVLVWITLVIPLNKEIHRISIIAGTISMLLISLMTNNPNKMVVYVTTFPGTVATGILFINQFIQNLRTGRASQQLMNLIVGACFLAFCAAITVFYVLGTPLGWYY